MANNRRDYQRHLKRFRSRYFDEGWRPCFTSDIAVSGIFFESMRIPRGEKLDLEVYIVDTAPMKLVGQLIRGARVPPQLVRIAKGGFAVRLLQAPPEWYEYCLSLTAKPTK